MIQIIMMLMSGILTFFGLPMFIKYFQNKKIGQTTREEGPLWHEVKTGTPTMGGTVFVSVSVVMILIYALISGQWHAHVWMILFTLILFGGIGFVDDFISIFKKQNEGLTAKQKFMLQNIFALFIMILPYVMGTSLHFNVFNFVIDNLIVIIIFGFIWINGFSNAVNLTDGLDGLAAGLNIIAYSTYALLAYFEGNTIIYTYCLIIVGSLIAFLYFNHKPAKIFMGDVGSLALGAGLAVISLQLNNPWSLLIVGFVFVAETLSVILQVASFKLTGKRIFKMSPIHHHFEMVGWSETKVVNVFWLVGLVLSIIFISFMVI